MDNIKTPLTTEYFGQRMLIKDSEGKTLGAFEDPKVAQDIVLAANRYDKMLGMITRLAAVDFINLDTAQRFVVLESFVMQADGFITGKPYPPKNEEDISSTEN